jgi:hypothetical protein
LSPNLLIGVIFALLCQNAVAEVRESHSMRDIFQQVGRGSLLVLDIDKTLIEVKPHGHANYRHTETQTLTEPGIPQRIQQAQKLGAVVIALTARPDEVAERTEAQLAEVGIDFTPNGGRIVYAGDTDKGQALLNYLEDMPQPPTRVIFADDKTENSQSVDRALTEAHIAHTSFHYQSPAQYVGGCRQCLSDLAPDRQRNR